MCMRVWWLEASPWSKGLCWPGLRFVVVALFASISMTMPFVELSFLDVLRFGLVCVRVCVHYVKAHVMQSTRNFSGLSPAPSLSCSFSLSPMDLGIQRNEKRPFGRPHLTFWPLAFALKSHLPEQLGCSFSDSRLRPLYCLITCRKCQ